MIREVNLTVDDEADVAVIMDLLEEALDARAAAGKICAAALCPTGRRLWVEWAETMLS